MNRVAGFMSSFWGGGTGYGMTKYGQEVISAIKAFGMVALDGTTVKNKTDVKGTFTATKAYLDTLEVQGSVDVSESTVAGESTIDGTLNAKKTIFKKGISISTNQATLDGSTATTILVRPSSGGLKQEITLSNKSTVDTITFEARNGVVHVKSGSKVTTVTGGEIKQGDDEKKEEL